MGLLIKVWREDRRRNKTILEFYPFGYFAFGLGKLYSCSYFFLCVYFSLLCFVFYVLTLSWSTDLMQSSHSSWFLRSIPFFLEILFRILLVLWLGVFDFMLFSSGSPSISPLCFAARCLVYTFSIVAIISSPTSSAFTSIQIPPTPIHLGLSSLQSISPAFPVIHSGYYLHLGVLPATQT